MVSPGQNDLSSDQGLMDPFVKKQNAKLIQVIQNFFSKSVQIVLQSRIQSEGHNTEDRLKVGGGAVNHNTSSKINKWFNLHMYNDSLPKEELKLWKNFNDVSQMPPMIIEVYLDLRQLTSRQTVVLRDDNGNPWTVAKGGSRKHEVVLERWLIEFDANIVSGTIVDELPLIYKQAIILFRSLYGYTRLMPAFKLKKSLNKSNLNIGCKILDGKQPISSKGRIGLSKSIIPHQMLTTESHMSHKHFLPIQTTLGTLKISIAYRNHHEFSLLDNEELLSTHFINIDDNKEADIIPIGTKSKEELSIERVSADEDLNKPEDDDADSSREHLQSEEPYQSFEQDAKDISGSHKKFSISNNASMSLSPCSSGPQTVKEDSPSYKKPLANTPPIVSQRPTINPFKVGSISTSPPATTNFGGSSLERKVSITSNKSASNASLAAMLRNPRSSTSSTNTTANIPIANNNSNNQLNSAVPRSISSSHGSNLAHDNDNILGFSNPENTSNTPRFSSSFGSRASRRFSNTSGRQSSLPSSNMNDTSLLATSAGLASSDAPMSGLYIDDDIGDFVRMIDSKSDLRFSGYNSNNDSKISYNQGSNSQIDALNKFQMLKNQHQQLSDSVSASLILHHNQLSGSRPSSRKSSHSIHSPPPSIPSGSYDNSHLPSINSKLRENSSTSGIEDDHGRDSGAPSPRKDSFDYTTNNNTTFLKNPIVNKLVSSPVTSTTPIHSCLHKTNNEPVISGLATTPSIYNDRRQIHYESVFDDDDDDDDYATNGGDNRNQDDSLKLYLTNKIANASKSRDNSRSLKSSNPPNIGDDDDDDDLLFTMSDMNLAKH